MNTMNTNESKEVRCTPIGGVKCPECGVFHIALFDEGVCRSCAKELRKATCLVGVSKKDAAELRRDFKSIPRTHTRTLKSELLRTGIARR